MKRSVAASFILIALTRACSPSVAGAETSEVGAETRFGLGVQLDLFPTVVSAAAGHFGYAPQLWFGIDHFRLRGVLARLEPPSALAFAEAGFENPTITVVAAMLDYTFGSRFDGLWLGVGIEAWWRTIEHAKVDGQARWTSTVLTAGGGYIWRIFENFYVDPWVGLHWTTKPETISLGEFSYEPPRIAFNASVKLGVFTDW